MAKSQSLPEPDPTVSGQNVVAETRGKTLSDQAIKWSPRNASLENPVSTLARYGLRLIDRVTGKAYSADEFASVALTGSISDLAGTLAILQGGTGATNAADALQNLGLTDANGDIIASLLVEDVTGVVPADGALGLFDGRIVLGDGVLESGKSPIGKSGIKELTAWDDSWTLIDSIVVPNDRWVLDEPIGFKFKTTLTAATEAIVSFNVRKSSDPPTTANCVTNKKFTPVSAYPYRITHNLILAYNAFTTIAAYNSTNSGFFEMVANAAASALGMTWSGALTSLGTDDVVLDVYIQEVSATVPSGSKMAVIYDFNTYEL